MFLLICLDFGSIQKKKKGCPSLTQDVVTQMNKAIYKAPCGGVAVDESTILSCYFMVPQQRQEGLFSVVKP